MSTEGYAEFLRHIGHKVRKVGNLYWFNVFSHVYMSFPFHHLANPNIFSRSDVLGLDGWIARYPCEIELGRRSYRIACDLKDYDFQSLSGKARNQTRRGLEACYVSPLEFGDLASTGLRLNMETLERQGRPIPRDFSEYWLRYYHFAGLADGAEAWGAFIGGNLAAYLIAFRMDGCSNILVVRSATEYLKNYPNNALLFNYIRYVLRESEIQEVSIGLESIQNTMESLDHFKFGMGFRQIPIGQRIEVAGWLKPFLNSYFLGGLHGFAQSKYIKDERFRKLSGMLQWYSEQPRI